MHHICAGEGLLREVLLSGQFTVDIHFKTLVELPPLKPVAVLQGTSSHAALGLEDVVSLIGGRVLDAAQWLSLRATCKAYAIRHGHLCRRQLGTRKLPNVLPLTDSERATARKLLNKTQRAASNTILVGSLTSDIRPAWEDLFPCDIKTLAPACWVNGNVLDCWCRNLEISLRNRGVPVLIVQTTFYTNYRSKGYAAVQRWFKDVRKAGEKVSLIGFPLHIHSNHWTAAVLDLQAYDPFLMGHSEPSKVIEYMDPLALLGERHVSHVVLPSADVQSGKAHMARVLKAHGPGIDIAADLVQFAMEEWAEYGENSILECDPSGTTVKITSIEEAPKQPDGHNCGPLSSRWMESRLQQVPPTHTSNQADEVRLLMLLELQLQRPLRETTFSYTVTQMRFMEASSNTAALWPIDTGVTFVDETQVLEAKVWKARGTGKTGRRLSSGVPSHDVAPRQTSTTRATSARVAGRGVVPRPSASTRQAKRARIDVLVDLATETVEVKKERE